MKHLGFTIQFLVLLVAIPLLMYAGIFHNDKDTTVKTPVENEASLSKVSSKAFVESMHFQMVIN